MEIEISHHCVDRFHERFRPALDLIKAREQLEMLVALHAVHADEPPDWFAERMLERADSYLIIGDDMVIPLARLGHRDELLLAKTCIGRGGVSDLARALSQRTGPLPDAQSGATTAAAVAVVIGAGEDERSSGKEAAQPLRPVGLEAVMPRSKKRSLTLATAKSSAIVGSSHCS